MTAYDCPDCGFYQTVEMTLEELAAVVQVHANLKHQGCIPRRTRMIGWTEKQDYVDRIERGSPRSRMKWKAEER